MVRGKIVHTIPDKIREILKLPQLKDDPDSFNRRMMRTDKGLDKILEDICIPGARWTTNTKGVPNQLKREDLKPVARGWLDFIGRSLLPTSNRSEVTVKRAVMIHCIMMGKEVEVHQLISAELYKIANKNSKEARLAYPSVISLLCKDAGVRMGITEYILVEKPITKASMEKQQAQDDPIKKRAQEFLSEIPQSEYWEYLETSVTKIREAMEQIIKEQKEHSQMLTYMFKEQEEQGRDLRELKRQKSSLVGPSTPRIRGTPVPPE